MNKKLTKKILLTIGLALLIGMAIVCVVYNIDYLIINIRNFIRVGVSAGQGFVAERVEMMVIFSLTTILLLFFIAILIFLIFKKWAINKKIK